MKLIRGSYAYIIGLLILGVDAIVSLVALFLSFSSGEDLHNPLLSEYGSRMASGVFSTVASAILTVFFLVFSGYTLFCALKKNSLAKPFRVIAVWLIVYAIIIVLTAIIYKPGDEPFFLSCLRVGKAALPIILAICLIRMSLDDLRFKIPSIVLCALCACQSFYGYGLYRAFIAGESATAEQARCYAAILLYAVSLLFFFIGLSLFIAGSTSGGKRKTAV